jgi:hypothetical protein
MKKIISVFILAIAIFGWFIFPQGSPENKNKLTQINSLKANEITSLRAIGRDFRDVTSDLMSTTEVKKSLLTSIRRSEAISNYANTPKNTNKLFLEIVSHNGSLGLDILVPTTLPTQSITDVQFILVERIYHGETYTEQTYGKWSSDKLWEFLVSAKLVVES